MRIMSCASPHSLHAQCPLKEDSEPALAALRASNHQLVMITGDAPLTACFTASKVERRVFGEGEEAGSLGGYRCDTAWGGGWATGNVVVKGQKRGSSIRASI